MTSRVAQSATDLTARGERRLRHYLKRARAIPSLARKLPGSPPWSAEIRLVGEPAMRRLNRQHRKKDYATDILSFPVPYIFRTEAGVLGELIICTPVLKQQARERGHTAARELDVLIVHGILHLLDFDHERGPKAAAEMARWEARLLGPAKAGKRPTSRGLIARAHSGKS